MAIVMVSLGWAGMAVSAETQDRVIASYDRSTELPDHIAFDTFLMSVYTKSDKPDWAKRIVGKALGLNINNREDAVRAATMTTYFSDMYAEMNQQQAAEIGQIVCSPDLRAKGFNEINDALNSLEDVRRIVVEDYMSLTMESLSAEEGAAFMNYLHQFKIQITHTVLDNRIIYEENPQRDIRADLDQHCIEANNPIESIEGNSWTEN